MMTIGQQKYYHVAGNDWIKSEDVYVYQMEKNKVKTKDVMITGLVDTHAKAIGNRGLSALSVWNTDKVITINDHKYYQVADDEFVDSDNVELIKA